ncbi:hypothetical protein UABAM_06682 [Candidatus Uabimicrobium amorphum]|uniref:Uncharacterized protein n=1 Tax=Uabimicrobium amorphum TaxID=2596890 RepID=A0A5S9F7E1_UABAM|nr:hypothetical protein UABAM_06682 [Candidatus Uabimicrobium amorphum]
MDRCALIIKKNNHFIMYFDNLDALKNNSDKGPQIYSKLNCASSFMNKDNTYIRLVCIIDFDRNSYLIYNTADFSKARDWKYLVA